MLNREARAVNMKHRTCWWRMSALGLAIALAGALGSRCAQAGTADTPAAAAAPATTAQTSRSIVPMGEALAITEPPLPWASADPEGGGNGGRSRSYVWRQLGQKGFHQFMVADRGTAPAAADGAD